jgi:high-affinity nickel-transport protein
MDLNTTTLLATSGLLLALGFRHGLDPDHIAAVDGMTRLRHKGSAYWKARLTGFQFACGHSLTILLATFVFYMYGIQLPEWLDAVGLWISTFFLVWLAYRNLKFCFSGIDDHHHAGSPVQRKILQALGPFAHPMGVGFGFAISFDSLAQAGLMAAKGHELGGLFAIIAMALSFGIGMTLADTSNGLLMHWLVHRSHALAHNAGRIMSGVIATLSLMVVAVGHASQHFENLEAIWDAWGAYIGLSVTGIAMLVYVVSMRLYRSAHPNWQVVSAHGGRHLHGRAPSLLFPK